jgi:hypothetical protein
VANAADWRSNCFSLQRKDSCHHWLPCVFSQTVFGKFALRIQWWLLPLFRLAILPFCFVLVMSTYLGSNCLPRLSQQFVLLIAVSNSSNILFWSFSNQRKMCSLLESNLLWFYSFLGSAFLANRFFCLFHFLSRFLVLSWIQACNVAVPKTMF